MQVISSGDRIWNAASHKPLDELVLTDETRGRLWSLPFKDKLRVLRTLVLARLHLTISN